LDLSSSQQQSQSQSGPAAKKRKMNGASTSTMTSPANSQPNGGSQQKGRGKGGEETFADVLEKLDEDAKRSGSEFVICFLLLSFSLRVRSSDGLFFIPFLECGMGLTLGFPFLVLLDGLLVQRTGV
jgi:hypothetical protein